MNINDYIKQNNEEFADIKLFIMNKYKTLFIDDNGFLLTNLNGVYLTDYKNEDTFYKIINLIPGTAELICTHTDEFEKHLIQKFSFNNKKICFQYIYKSNSLFEIDNNLIFKTLDLSFINYLNDNYPLAVNKDYLKQLIISKRIIGAFVDNTLAGFIGTHESNTMGLLYVNPLYRGNKIGSSLEKHLINELVKKNIIPLCHVETNNIISNHLQQKLNLTKCDKKVYWYSK